MLPQRIAGHPHAGLAMPSVSLLKWGDVSKTASGPLPLATLEAPDASGKEEEFYFETPAPALSWPSPQHLVNGSTMARWTSDMEGCALAATMETETSTMDEGEQAAAHAPDEPGALEEPPPLPLPPPPPPEDPKAPPPAVQTPALPAPPAKPADEPCDEDMQNSQEDARLDALQQPRDDLSTATERTANGGDFRLQLPPLHPLAEVHFASESLPQPNSGVQSRSRRHTYGTFSNCREVPLLLFFLY